MTTGGVFTSFVTALLTDLVIDGTTDDITAPSIASGEVLWISSIFCICIAYSRSVAVWLVDTLSLKTISSFSNMSFLEHDCNLNIVIVIRIPILNNSRCLNIDLFLFH